MKGRSIKDNLHLIHEVLVGIEDGTEAALISLDKSKAFDRVEHRFLATVLETTGFEPEFRKWIFMMYHNPQVNGMRSGTFAIERSVRQGCPLSPLLYVLALEPLLRRLRDEGTNPALRGVPFADPLTAWVSAFADDITVFVSRRLDIKAVKKAVGEYERIAGAKVNFDKSEGLWLGAWRGSDTVPGPFRWSDVPVSMLDWLYFLCLRHVGWRFSNPSPDCSGEVQGRWSVDGSASNVRATGVCVCLIWRATGLLKDLHTWADPWRTDAVWRQKASRTFPRLKSDPKAEGRRKPLCEALFVRECRTALRNLFGSSDLSRPRKELYRELVEGFASDPLSERCG